ncbi:hypothetical protein CWB99_04855 [Pseudoalteromonas rubra]|uniref:Uncharacterized protein n=1 Tax=Pseudoalteromonas rubra TaxID=43658 RepID=A0A5S3WT50_9GAMM|nr:hypothetical protein CWB99_04855 [Pseudoalteromonas rubra]TMP34669.1 hypothetical protein CWC00_07755 [Pseudoalteromonas rubra]
MPMSKFAMYLVDSIAPCPKKVTIDRGEGVTQFLSKIINSKTLLLPSVPGKKDEPFEYTFDEIEFVFENDTYAVFIATSNQRKLNIKLYQYPRCAIKEPFNHLDPSGKYKKNYDFPCNVSLLEGALYENGFQWFWVRNVYLDNSLQTK